MRKRKLYIECVGIPSSCSCSLREQPLERLLWARTLGQTIARQLTPRLTGLAFCLWTHSQFILLGTAHGRPLGSCAYTNEIDVFPLTISTEGSESLFEHQERPLSDDLHVVAAQVCLRFFFDILADLQSNRSGSFRRTP